MDKEDTKYLVTMTQEEHYNSMFKNEEEKHNFELRQENKQLRDKLDKIKEYVEYHKWSEKYIKKEILEIIGDNNDNTNN